MPKLSHLIKCSTSKVLQRAIIIESLVYLSLPHKYQSYPNWLLIYWGAAGICSKVEGDPNHAIPSICFAISCENYKTIRIMLMHCLRTKLASARISWCHLSQQSKHVRDFHFMCWPLIRLLHQPITWYVTLTVHYHIESEIASDEVVKPICVTDA